MSKPQHVPTSQLVFPNAEQVTANQINNLLQIGSLAITGLLGGQGGMFGAQNEAKELPGESKPAAENLLVAVCEKLEEIVKDKQRWSLDKQRQLEADFMKAHQKNMEYLEHQTQAAYNITTPHFRFHPTLARTQTGLFAAVLGNPADPDNAIIGLGRTPEEALRNFDEMFNEGVPAVVQQYLERREKAIENNENPGEYPNLKNETSNVDSGADEKPEAPKRKWSLFKRHRKGPRQDNQSGGSQSGETGPVES